MDNPQETEKLNIQWLAGFFDAEGSVSFNYKPNIDFVNTCPRTSFHIKDILSKLGIKAGMHYREKPSKSSKKPRWDIFLRHEYQIKPFLQHVMPYVYGKQKQLQLINEWYQNKRDISEKIRFANQVNHIVISRPETVKEKLKTDDLNKYSDISLLNDDDGYIREYSDFSNWGYVAGLVDGDGCFNMHFRASKRSQIGRYTPQVMLINTNKEIIRRYCSVLGNNNIGYHISFRVAGKTTNRRRWDILVSGIKRCENICQHLYPYLETKKEQCNLLFQYCKHRLLNPKKLNEIGFECKKALESMRSGKKYI